MIDKIRKWVCPVACIAMEISMKFMAFYEDQGPITKLMLFPLYLVTKGISIAAFLFCGCGT